MNDVKALARRLRMARRTIWATVLVGGATLSVLLLPISVRLYMQHDYFLAWAGYLVKAALVITAAELSRRVQLRWSLRLLVLAVLLRGTRLRESDLVGALDVGAESTRRQLEWLRRWDVRHGRSYFRVGGGADDARESERTYDLTDAGRRWARRWVNRFGGMSPKGVTRESWVKDPALWEWATASLTVDEMKGIETLRPWNPSKGEVRQPWHATTSMRLPTQRSKATIGVTQIRARSS